MYDPLEWAIHEIGNQWLALGVFAYLAIYHSGVIGRLTGASTAARMQLSKDQQALVENLQGQVMDLHERIISDREACRQEIETIREERAEDIAKIRIECENDLRRMRDQVGTLVAGESRWRHLTSNLATYVAALQFQLRQNKIEVPRFTGWDSFIEEGGDLGGMISG